MNRQRFADHGLVQLFFDRVNRQAILEAAADREEFALDGTLIASYTSLKSLRPISTGSPESAIRPRMTTLATRRSTSAGRSVATPRTAALSIPKPGWPARATASRPC